MDSESDAYTEPVIRKISGIVSRMADRTLNGKKNIIESSNIGQSVLKTCRLAVKVEIPEFLNRIGYGVESHVPKSRF